MRGRKRNTVPFKLVPIPKEFSTHITGYTEDTGGAVDTCKFYLIQGQNIKVLIDTGPSFRAETNLVESLGEELKDTTHVFLTHWHWDHTGGAHHFKNAIIAIHSADKMALMRATLGGDDALENYFLDERYRFVAPAQVSSLEEPALSTLNLGNGASLHTFHTPGHTPGSSVFVYKNNNANCLFTGDALYQNKLVAFNESNIAQWIDSLQYIGRLIADHDIKHVFAGHYNSFSAEQGKRLIETSILKLKSSHTSRLGCCLNCFYPLQQQQQQVCSGCMRATYCGGICAENHWNRIHHQKCINM